MPPKKQAPKIESKLTSKNGDVPVEESVPSKPKKIKAQTEKQETLALPSVSTRIVTKRGTQLNSADYQSEEEVKDEPVKKRGKTKVADKEKPKAPAKKDTVKKSGKKAEDTEQTKNKSEGTEQKIKKAEKSTAKNDTKKRELKEKKPVTKKEGKVATSSKSTDDTKNKTLTDWTAIKFNCDKKSENGSLPNLKVTSWNVDGVRAWVKKGGLNILEYDSPDIFCLQETKCADDKLPEEINAAVEYHKFWCASTKNGYAGVGLLTKIEPIKVTYGIGHEEQDEDGRCLTAEYEKFFLVNVYVPNAGRKLVTLDKRLEWNNLFKHFIKELDKKKPVIICGDFNVAHNEIDLTNPKTNKKNAGFTEEERDGMTNFLQDGFIDTFRWLYPDQKDVYTFWVYLTNARKKNIGWRLDYFLISKNLQDKICDNVVLDKVYGSDHCPITLFISI